MLTESNKLDDTCTYTIGLTNYFCKVLELDDASYGGETKKQENGSPFVDFATSGSRVTTAIKPWSYVMPNHDVDAPKTVAKTELGLSYSRNDELPDLLALGDTASAGRMFCKVLCSDLRTTWDTIKENWENEREEEKKEEIEEDTKEQEEGDATDVEDSEGDDDVDDDDTDAEENKEEEAIRYYPEKQNWSPPRLPTSSKSMERMMIAPKEHGWMRCTFLHS
ncbi:unnamed protein product [Fusarium venenatum]|uniref:Uncharacterized protein n=1 Tax=Fusarium venenatum TaxID=56646 RepID=A0A2L2T2M8_9HYPO|nr:LOW QUALITY PROTEIN: uncharacterized protein FVRRES_06239 [Fusarium venenatum]CEI61803.1 unnamed protein product [Fusarium venenatum]